MFTSLPIWPTYLARQMKKKPQNQQYQIYDELLDFSIHENSLTNLDPLSHLAFA